MQVVKASRLYFNSQPHKEADPRHSDQNGCHWHFNSQPHKEADMRFSAFPVLLRYFNSQPHKEADCNRLVAFPLFTISTHSLTRRLTEQFVICSTGEIFQLTASQGG